MHTADLGYHVTKIIQNRGTQSFSENLHIENRIIQMLY